MKFSCIVVATVLILCALFNRDAMASTKAYALIIGNNTPAPDTDLESLRYADDDAARYYRFFKRFTEETFLMTVLDSRTQQKYPQIAFSAKSPTLSNFERAVQKIKLRMESDKRKSHETVLYLAYSGHGDHNADGDPFLTLLDGGITQKVLFDALSSIDADYSHLFVDACYAEGVVASRGAFGVETSGRHVSVSRSVAEEIKGKEPAPYLPGLGIVIASSALQKTHEWSKIESGIFTHEVLSGLSGPADVNLDGKIEYSELVAFASAANRKIVDDRGRVHVTAKAPSRNHRIPLVDLRSLSNVAYISGDPSDFGHFHIELSNGERYLDANLGDMRYMHVVIPSEEGAYLHSKQGIASLFARTNGVIELVDLEYEETGVGEKGYFDSAFRRGLFKAEYGRRYYDGFVDSNGLVSVQFDEPSLSVRADIDSQSGNSNYSLRRKMAYASFITAGVSAVTAISFGTAALAVKKEFNSTEYHKTSVDANDKYRKYSGSFWGTLSVVPVGLVLGWLLLPPKVKKLNHHISLFVIEKHALSISFRF